MTEFLLTFNTANSYEEPTTHFLTLRSFMQRFCPKVRVDGHAGDFSQGTPYFNFFKGYAEIELFVYRRSYLFCTSPINILPKKDLEPVLSYMLSSEQFAPYQLGLDDNQIYISYRIHISDVFSGYADEVKKNITNMAFKADELDNFLVENYGCELSEYAK